MPVRLDPLWHTGLLPLLFFISSVGMGLSTVILVSLIAGRAFNREVEMNVLEGLAKGSVWVWVVYLAFKLQQLLFGGLLDEALAFDIRSIWYLLEMVVGVILPIILYAMPNVRKSKSGLFWTSILVTVGILLNRFNATLTGQTTGAQWAIQTVTETATYTPYWMEYSIQIGVLAAAAIAWYLIARHLPIFPEDIKKAH
jgi:Ni/Fe-hydrogenase subunit HybB-like protein